MNQHIRAVYQSQDDFLAFVALQVDGQAALVAVQTQKDRAFAVDWKRLAARDVAGILAFYLDHIRPKVAQHLRAHRPHLDLVEVEHPHALERVRHQQPLQTGFRLSANARGPSRLSSDAAWRSMYS